LQHDITAVVWHDTHDILIFPTSLGFETDTVVARKIRKNKEEINISYWKIIMNYTSHIGGVNLSYQEREYYKAGRHLRHGGNVFFIFF